jgi:hypothetical protein
MATRREVAEEAEPLARSSEFMKWGANLESEISL